jgi:hypothetical protein
VSNEVPNPIVSCHGTSTRGTVVLIKQSNDKQGTVALIISGCKTGSSEMKYFLFFPSSVLLLCHILYYNSLTQCTGIEYLLLRVSGGAAEKNQLVTKYLYRKKNKSSSSVTTTCAPFQQQFTSFSSPCHRPLIWFILLDSATGQSYKGTSPLSVSLPSGSVVDQF